MSRREGDAPLRAREFEKLSVGAPAPERAPSVMSDEEVEQIAVLQDALEWSDAPPADYVRVFHWDRSASSDGGRSAGRDTDTAAKTKRLLERLAAVGPDRRLMAPGHSAIMVTESAIRPKKKISWSR